MALREVRTDGDPILRKRSREVDQITDRIKITLDDMLETMYHTDGVGLAGPQIGVLRRIIVIDDRDEEGPGPLKMINPVILNREGSCVEVEGCLSVPDRTGMVERPESLLVEYLDENGKEKSMEAEGFLARIICHEVDHLDGILYIDIMEEEIFIEEGDI